jgi:hypothetical protein
MLATQKEGSARQETTIKDFGDIVLKESKICQQRIAPDCYW